MTYRSLTALILVLMATRLSATESDSPLADALKNQDRKTAHRLLDQGVDVDAAHVDGMTPLHWAVYHNDVELTKAVVDAGANVRAKNRYGVSPLALACTNGSSTIVNLLLDGGADANATLSGGETTLMTAARTGKLGPVKALIEHGCDLNAKERRGQTAIMWAAADGHTAVVDLLIEAGADFRTPLKSGFTPLLFAVREGHTDTALALIKAGIDVNDVAFRKGGRGKGLRNGTSPLILAVENGHFELAVALLQVGANPNDDRCGFHPLHAMTWVRKPVRGDGDPSPVGSGKLSSLQFVRQLVSHGADVNPRHGKQSAGKNRLNRTGATPFLLAAEAGDVPLMRLLVELGADPMLNNVDNCTPLLAACGVGVLSDGDESAGTEEDAIDTVGLLLELGGDINAVDDHGKTCMHGAAYKSWNKLIQFLADHGANVDVWNRKSRRGVTPLKIAQGHRPGNFRPSPETVEAILRVMNGQQADP